MKMRKNEEKRVNTRINEMFRNKNDFNKKSFENILTFAPIYDIIHFVNKNEKNGGKANVHLYGKSRDH